MQNYEALHNYFMDNQRNFFLSPQNDMTAKLQLVVDHSIGLGLRNPSEPTLALMTALVMCCVEGGDNARPLLPNFLPDV